MFKLLHHFSYTAMSSYSPQPFYQANAVNTVCAKQILFPLLLSVKRPSTQAAVTEAKLVIERIKVEIASNPIPGGNLQVRSLEDGSCGRKTFITVTQESKNSVRLHIQFFAVLTVDRIGEFWQCTELISKYLDFFRNLTELNLGKDIDLALKKALFPNDNSKHQLNYTLE